MRSSSLIIPCADAVSVAARRLARGPADLFSLSASVCKGAKADVVFLIDGSWSIGEESFTKVVHFVSDMIGAFDVIGPSGMQVCAEDTESQCLCSCFTETPQCRGGNPCDVR